MEIPGNATQKYSHQSINLIELENTCTKIQVPMHCKQPALLTLTYDDYFFKA